MRYVSDLLRTPAGRYLTLVAGPWEARAVSGVFLVNTPAEIEDAPSGAVAVLSPAATDDEHGLSVMEVLRAAGRLELSAVVMQGPAGLSPAVVELASRTRVALITGASDHSLADLAAPLRDALRSDPDLLLRRTRQAIERLGTVEGAGEEDILAAASETVGVEFRVAGTSATNAAVIRVNGRADDYVCWSGDDPAAAIVAGVVATMLGRLRAAAAARERALSEAILAVLRAADVAPVARKARVVGVPIDGWHVGVFVRGTTISPELMAATSDLGGAVNTTPWQDGMLLLRTTNELPGFGEDPLVPERLAGLTGGIGTCLSGPEGLRRTASQARAAAGRAQRGEVVAFDRLGVHAILAELSTSDSAQVAARAMLAPLSDLGALSAHAVVTLKAHLDSWGSRTRAAEQLGLHPNAVAHRVRRIAEALGVDLSDPQTRFALQVACHVWVTNTPG